MQSVTVKKADLVAVLAANRAKHAAVFEEALNGYKAAVIDKLEDALRKARNGERVLESFHIPQPVNQTHEYNRALRMLEMSVDDTIKLSAQEFEQYVMDRWVWKRQFLATNSMYSISAAREASAETDED